MHWFSWFTFLLCNIASTVKEEIQSCALELQQVCKEVKTRQGELAVRNVKMVDQEVEAKLLELRKAILEEQRNKLSAENQILTSELVISMAVDVYWQS